MAKAIGSDSPAQVQSYLKGVDYPTNKETLVKTARRNKAPEDVMKIIDELPEDDFDSPVDVMKAYGEIHKSRSKSHMHDASYDSEEQAGMHEKKQAGGRGRGG